MADMRFLPLTLWISLTVGMAVGQSADLRTIEFKTSEVTSPDVTLSPDGHWLVFTMLGHLFRLPVEGGDAKQLTFGPYYDSDPIISPDGTRVAFGSDRDGSESNVFVLELASGAIRQITDESWVSQPMWTPDGQALVYQRLAHVSGLPPVKVSLARVTLADQETQSVGGAAGYLGPAFYLHDGRLAWTQIEFGTGFPRVNTRIEAMNPDGQVSTLRTIGGYAYPVVSSPSGDGLYVRRGPLESFNTPSQSILFVPIPEGTPRTIMSVESDRWYWPPGFAVSSENNAMYVGTGGRLWRVPLPSGTPETIPFTARVQLEVHEGSGPVTPLLGSSSAPPRIIVSPRLSPDGRTLVFGAGGFLWQQPLDGGPVTRLFAGSAVESSPAFSPGGQRLAFLRSEHGKSEIRVFNFDNRESTVIAVGALVYENPAWSPDGRRLCFVEGASEHSRQLVIVDVLSGAREQARKLGAWSARPAFSTGGDSIYFSAKTSGVGALYRVPLSQAAKATPEPVTQLERHLSDGSLSPNGKQLAFRRNTEIWIASLGVTPVKEEDVRLVSSEGGASFSFTPDSSALIYAVGNTVWKYSVAGGDKEQISIRLKLSRPATPPLLLRRVRLIDLDAGEFRPETSLFVSEGRIRGIGPDAGDNAPSETVTVDAAGRFAMPGLFDMHAHVWESVSAANLDAFIAYGVTALRDPGGGSLPWMGTLVDRSEFTNDPVPRVFFAGQMFHGATIPFDGYLLVDDQENARNYVQLWKEQGAQFIKAYITLPWPMQRAIAEEARREGLPVAGHGVSVEEITKGVTSGYTYLEHTSGHHEDVLQLLLAAGTKLTPTLAPRGVSLVFKDEPERRQDAKFRSFVKTACIEGPLSDSRDLTSFRGVFARNLTDIFQLHRRGVPIFPGTDFGCFYGPSLHWELEFLVQAGLSSRDVLRSATVEAAEAVGAKSDLGTLESGKLADIVLLDANPLEDIRHTQKIWRVIKGGWVFNPEDLRHKPSGN